MIYVEDLRKVFHDKRRGGTVMAVDGITFEAKPGEIFGLLGSNGAGKTTTLRMLATILKPTSGTARVAGHDVIADASTVRRNIGFLSGDMGYYHRLTPREVLMLFGHLNGVSKGDLRPRVNRLIESFEMTPYADSRMDTFSTGMRQRLAVARVLVHDPSVLILDEPTSGLDVPTSQIIEGFIMDARAAGKCIVLSTHVMEEAEYLCDRIAVVHQGRIQALGTMDELRARTGKHRLREVFLDLLNVRAAGAHA
jgi:sodium transport system ATP-binding protein